MRVPAACLGQNIDVPALGAQHRQIAESRFGAGNNDGVGIQRDGLAGRHEIDGDARLRAQGIEVVEIGDMRQHGHGNMDCAICARDFSGRCNGTASSAGRRLAACSHGTTPSAGHPVCAATSFMPGVEKRNSAAEFVDQKSADAGAIAGREHLVSPTRLAMTPPRSISPISTTGTPKASAKPIFATSPWRRLVSAGLPAPSTSNSSQPSAMWRKLSPMAGRSMSRLPCQLRASSRPATRPCTMICDV